MFIRCFVLVHEIRRVGVAVQIADIDFASLQQLMNHRKDKEAVRAGRDADPLVSDGVIARPHRVHADNFRATRLQAAKAHLDGV